MKDIEIIKEIEKEYHILFDIVSFDNFQYKQKTQYSLDEDNNVIGLKISKITLGSLTSIAKLSNLKKLILTDCNLNDVSDLKDLTNLTYLNLANNEIEDISALKKLNKLTTLILISNNINDISVLGNLDNITALDLYFNRVSDISVLKNLKNIKELYLGGNLIDDVSALKELKLSWLTLEFNNVNDISSLKPLFKVVDFNSFIIETPLKYPPLEIVSLGHNAVNEYFEHIERGKSILREGKIIVLGETGAGKTTFAKRIQNIKTENINSEYSKTGVNVYDWKFKTVEDNDYNVKIWDFAAQDIYFNTHKFFYSEKSLFVLVVDANNDKTDFKYWLNTIEQITGEKSKLIIIINSKNDNYFNIDEAELAGRFGKIISKVIQLDLSNENDIIELQKIIKLEISNLPQIGYILPNSWIKIRKDLKNYSAKHVSFEKFREICKFHNITSPRVIKIISRLFTSIGIFTHFSDEYSSLQDIIFLDANWLTKNIYLLLNNEAILKKKGNVNINEISEIWSSDELYFEKNKFIEVLLKFNLIYRISGTENFMVPELLSKTKPYKQWKYDLKDGVYQFRYLFDNYMPKGLMPRLIVVLHQHIYDNNLVWYNGVNIANSVLSPDTFAEIVETYGKENRFDIKIFGKNHIDLLNIITYHIDNLLKTYKKLNYKKLIPCNCDTCKTSIETTFYDYEELKNRKENNKKTIGCNYKPYHDVDINSLMFGINFTELRSLLLNEQFEEFEMVINQRFADISYQIHKNKVSEGFFHSIFHTILSENGLNPISEESTNKGRIDIHLTIGETKFLFELKINKTAEEALNQIYQEEYYQKFQRTFKRIVLIGMNFNSKTRNIQGLKTNIITKK
jgi:Leucine-rich repeat (LRR) protein